MLCCHADLVFIQNGMLQPWLDARGLGSNTQVPHKHQLACAQPTCLPLITNIAAHHFAVFASKVIIAGTSLLCCFQER